jgi:ABC-type multidrug transport system fused ATPase/permease subunit
VYLNDILCCYSFARNWLFFSSSAAGANRIHTSLFDVIIRGRMRFFDTTPTGSLVNRFSGDMQVVQVT